MTVLSDINFNYDHMRINFTFPVKKLKTVLTHNTIEQLKSDCRQFNITRCSDKAQRCGFRSCIVCVLPGVKFFTILRTYEPLLGKYRISKIELAFDFLCRSKAEADEINHFIAKHLIAKYSRNNVLYFGNKAPDAESEFISNFTRYAGSRNSKLVNYARTSKVFQRIGKQIPCLHMEWRLNTAKIVRQKTNISTFADLINFSHKKWLLNKCSKGLKMAKINHLNHGRFIKNKNHHTKLQDKYFGIASQKFCIQNRINSAAELKQFYISNKKRLYGTQTEKKPEEVRITKLSRHKIESFTKPIEASDYAYLSENNKNIIQVFFSNNNMENVQITEFKLAV